MARVDPFRNFIFLCTLLLIVAGCANKSLVSQKLPLISHAHIGHALTSWRGTPDEQGLFVVAENEIHIALEEANKASQSTKPATISKHLSNTLYALNPKMQKQGNSHGYGAIRALSEATDHMLYAAQSKDASENLAEMVNNFNESQVHVANRMVLAVEIIQLAKKATAQEQQELIKHLQNTLHAVLDGEDTNQNGKVDAGEETGLLQLRKIISVGLRNEVPAYQPAGKKYLLGLVRLSNGNWAYKFDSSNKRRRLGY